MQQTVAQSAQVAVIVRGVDSHGYPFMQTAQAIRYSRISVELAGIDCLNGAADVVTLEFKRRRCRYRVAWIGCDKDGRGGHARLESLDPITYIFDSETQPLSDAPPQSVPDLPKAIPAAAAVKTPTERRRYERYSWGANAQVRKKGIPVNTPCKVGDISLGGCYVELMTPFPEAMPVELDLFWNARKLTIDARVATSHPSIGMGLFFCGFSEDQYRLLQELIEVISGKRQIASPAISMSAVNPAALTQDLFDWFERHTTLSREQFEQLVEKQKPKNVSSASPALISGTGT